MEGTVAFGWNEGVCIYIDRVTHVAGGSIDIERSGPLGFRHNGFRIEDVENPAKCDVGMMEPWVFGCLYRDNTKTLYKTPDWKARATRVSIKDIIITTKP